MHGQGAIASIAVVATNGPGKTEEEGAPYNVNGVWNDVCLSPTYPDPDDVPPLGSNYSSVQIYRHDFTPGTGSPLAAAAAGVNQYPFKVNLRPNSAVLVVPSTGSEDKLCLSSNYGGMEIFGVDQSTGAISQVAAPFAGEVFGTGDCTVSLVNPGVVHIAGEILGKVALPRQMVYIDPVSNEITPVPITEWSPCPDQYPQTPNCTPALSGDPGLYAGSIMEEAHWLDPLVRFDAPIV